MDPLMIVLLLWPRYRMRPLVIEYIYRQPWIRPLMRFVRALSIPNFETSVNEIKVKKAEKVLQQLAEELRKGDHFLLYPSGKLKHSGKEIIGGSSATHSLMEQVPDVNVVLIRTTGLWGSSFSRALTGRSPDLKTTILHGIMTAFKNLLFFIPRRRVLIEIEAQPEDLPRRVSRIDFNRYLERWYNRYEDVHGTIHESEPIYLVSYRFWRKELAKPYQSKRKAGMSREISEVTREHIYAAIRKIIERPDGELNPEMNLALDLGMDSLQIAELIAVIGHEHGLMELHPEDVETIQNILELAEGIRVAEPSVHQLIQGHWPREKKRPSAILPQGATIPEAFLHACDRFGSHMACGDDLVGALSYKKLKKAALVLSEEIKYRFRQKHIGILLPASVGAYILIFAIHLAGKVPVMLNWTLGPRALDDMVDLAKVEVALSSWRFLERLSYVEFGKIGNKVHLLEDLRGSLAWKSKIRGVFRSFLSATTLMQSIKVSGDQTAVILFTSGTEASPKGVPLSHRNILANQRAGMHCFDLKGRDVFYGILPPFHSFGFSLVGILPLITGIRIAFFPDPTDSFALAEGIARWKATILCSAPSFLKGLFQAAKKEQLKTVRYFVVGAEKAGPDLYAYVKKIPHAQLIEGYGITECSPVLTLNRPNRPPKGVGRPLPDVEICTIHPETLEPLPEGEEGEICVRGPNVFHGYLGNPRSPFITLDGTQWYRTGDLGHLDHQHHLFLSGRLKRFTKVGGEMISLGAIEEAIAASQGHSRDVVDLAVCVDESNPDKSQLILFTTFEIEKDAANEILRKSGLSRLMKINRVQKVAEIPLLGIGKTDYRKLQTLVNNET
jgi:acyl-CoA synthetase (AMP-forming)/AMP-acid ligase II/acyl carrier protein